jgi:hypothetical protein
MDKGRGFIKDKQAVLTDAVEAGRAAMQSEHKQRGEYTNKGDTR